MQALKLTLPGDYWDVQIYRGRLHLWTMAGSILTLDWERLVESQRCCCLTTRCN